MRMLVRIGVGCALLVGGVGAVTAAQDPQAKVEPRSAPGAGQTYLERFVGDWDVAKAFYPRTGEPTRLTGRCQQRMIQQGRFLQSEFRFGEGASASTGLGLIGYEPETDTFTSVWVDSRQTAMSVRRSREKFDGRQIVLYSKPLDEAAPNPRRSRTVSRIEDDGRKIVHQQFSITDDGERLLMELVLTRRTPAPQ